MNGLKRILLVEDDPKDVELTLTGLAEYNLANEVVVARDGEDALDFLFRRGQHQNRPNGNPAVMLLLGLVLSGSVNAVKVTSRPAVTLGTGGILNPIVSVAEDIVATAASLVAIFLPGLVLLILVIFAVSSILLVRRFRRSRVEST